MGEATLERFSHLWWDNTVANQPFVEHGIFDARVKRDDVDLSSTVIVAHGPSLKRHKSLETLRQMDYRGLVIAVDSATGACLDAGIVPDCVVCVDPRARIVHNFGGHEEHDRLHPDDEKFYLGLGGEGHLGPDPMVASRMNRELMDRYGERMIGLFSTSVSARVTARCREAGLDIFWWNPMYDDYEQEGSFTRQVYDRVPVPCVNAGGNVGTAAWVLAHAVFKVPRVALVAFDFAYYADTPREKTQYYGELVKLFGADGLDDVMPEFTHPRTGEVFFTDPAFLWFRQILLDMAREAPCETVNCTEGGIVFGEGIAEMALAEFVHSAQRRP